MGCPAGKAWRDWVPPESFHKGQNEGLNRILSPDIGNLSYKSTMRKCSFTKYYSLSLCYPVSLIPFQFWIIIFFNICRELQRLWDKDPFLRSGGDSRISKRKEEGYRDAFAVLHCASPTQGWTKTTWKWWWDLVEEKSWKTSIYLILRSRLCYFYSYN